MKRSISIESRPRNNGSIQNSAATGAATVSATRAPPTMAIPDLLSYMSDKTVVVRGGGGLTIESHADERKQKLFEQYKIARRLRAIMEHAADEVEANNSSPKETLQIIIQHKTYINELVALTQAVRGNYFLNNYHVYSTMYQEKEKIHEKEIRAASKVVRGHLRDWAIELDPDLKKNIVHEKQEEDEAVEDEEKQEDNKSNHEDEMEDRIIMEQSMLVNVIDSDNTEDEMSNVHDSESQDGDNNKNNNNSMDTEMINDSTDEAMIDKDAVNKKHESVPDHAPSQQEQSSISSALRRSSKADSFTNNSSSTSKSSNKKSSAKSSSSTNNRKVKKTVSTKGPQSLKKRSQKASRTTVTPTTRSSTMSEKLKQAKSKKKRSLRCKKGNSSSSSVTTTTSAAATSAAATTTTAATTAAAATTATAATATTTAAATTTARLPSSPTPSTTTSSNVAKDILHATKSSLSNSGEKKSSATSNLSTSSSTNIKTSNSSQTKASIKSKTSSRKCHYCKNSTAHYLRCHFFFVNGNKCGKVFCRECMVSKFEIGDYDKCVGDLEWHCPSCLGKCECVNCVKNRARTERQTYTHARRSKSRAAECSSYLY